MFFLLWVLLIPFFKYKIKQNSATNKNVNSKYFHTIKLFTQVSPQNISIFSTIQVGGTVLFLL
jgi:hypothetical protein